MSLLEAWKAKCPYINALDLKRGKNRPLYSYMSSVITEGLALDTSAPPPSLPTPAERVRIAAIDTAELRVWWRGRSLAQRSAVLAFPLQVMTNPNPNPNPNPSPNPNPNPNPDPNQVRLRRSLFSSLMRQELDFFSAVRTGDMTSRLSADCQKVGFARDHNLTSASTLHLYSL